MAGPLHRGTQEKGLTKPVWHHPGRLAARAEKEVCERFVSRYMLISALVVFHYLVFPI